MGNLTAANPFRELDDFFDKYFNSRRGFLTGDKNSDNKSELTLPDWNPSVDITETAKAYKIKAELPGVKKDDVNVTLEDGVLTIRGEKHFEKESQEEKTHRVESSYGSFVRSFSIPKDVNDNEVQASYTDGVLELTVPKAQQSKKKSIDIKVK